MSTKTKKVSLKSYLMSMIAMAIVAAVALGGATYAWFTSVSNPEIRNIDLYVKAAENIFISAYDTDDMEEMKDSVRLYDIATLWYGTLYQRNDEDEPGTDSIEANQPLAFPHQLSDVSSVFSLANRGFYYRNAEATGDFISYNEASPGSGSPTGEALFPGTANGHYVKFHIWFKSTADGVIYLDLKDAADQFGSYVKAMQKAADGTISELATPPNKYVENTVRIGFYTELDGGVRDSDGTTIKDQLPRAVVWEPNSTDHLPVHYGGPDVTTGTYIPTDKAIADEFTPGTGQTEANAVTDEQKTYDAARTNLTSGAGNKLALFNLTSGKAVKVEIYIWIEGTDPDTKNDVAKNWFQTMLRFSQDKTGRSYETVTTP